MVPSNRLDTALWAMVHGPEETAPLRDIASLVMITAEKLGWTLLDVTTHYRNITLRLSYGACDCKSWVILNSYVNSRAEVSLVSFSVYDLWREEFIDEAVTISGESDYARVIQRVMEVLSPPLVRVMVDMELCA